MTTTTYICIKYTFKAHIKFLLLFFYYYLIYINGDKVILETLRKDQPNVLSRECITL